MIYSNNYFPYFLFINYHSLVKTVANGPINTPKLFSILINSTKLSEFVSGKKWKATNISTYLERKKKRA